MSDDSLKLLSASQRQYLALVGLGLNSKQIARVVGTSPAAVDKACTRALKAAGFDSRFTLARLLLEHEPELSQSVYQRYGLSAKRLADLLAENSDQPVEPVSGSLAVTVSERRWNDLPVWQRRALAAAVALGTLVICTLLITLSRHVLVEASHLHF